MPARHRCRPARRRRGRLPRRRCRRRSPSERRVSSATAGRRAWTSRSSRHQRQLAAAAAVHRPVRARRMSWLTGVTGVQQQTFGGSGMQRLLRRWGSSRLGSHRQQLCGRRRSQHYRSCGRSGSRADKRLMLLGGQLYLTMYPTTPATGHWGEWGQAKQATMRMPCLCITAEQPEQ